MKEWNVVITVFQDGFRRALRALQKLGEVDHGHYHNVLGMKVDDPMALLAAIEQQTALEPALFDAISRVAPVLRSFEFHSADEFKEKAKAAVLEWAPRLAGKCFHVRLHRRGFKHELESPEAEKYFGAALLDALAERGTPSSISLSDPDVIISIETIDHRAGLSIFSRDDLALHPLLRPD
jgi:tRNA(Ser,Leu) C12 N-acetylase TAN1